MGIYFLKSASSIWIRAYSLLYVWVGPTEGDEELGKGACIWKCYLSWNWLGELGCSDGLRVQIGCCCREVGAWQVHFPVLV